DDREDHVYGRSRKRDDRALPAWFRKKRTWVGRGVFVARLIPRHLDVSAEEDCGEPEIGFPFAEPEQARAEAEAEGLHFNVEEPRCPLMAKLVDKNHHSDEDQIPPKI